MNKPDYISKPDWDLLVSRYKMNKIKKKLKQNYPYQYLLKDVFFYNSLIKVNKNVLIPRWETEELVSRVIKKLDFKPQKCLDICTGSGCIAISCAKGLGVSFDAIDVSKKALKVAKKNAKINKVDINFIKSDVLKEDISGKYDLIICNPPYVAMNDEVGLETKYEPKLALFADDDGLIFYKELLSKLKNNVNDKYLIAMEIGASQNREIMQLAKSNFKEEKVVIEKDFNNRYRYLFITNSE